MLTTRFQPLLWPQPGCLILGTCLIIGSFTLHVGIFNVRMKDDFYMSRLRVVLAPSLSSDTGCPVIYFSSTLLVKSEVDNWIKIVQTTCFYILSNSELKIITP